MNGETRTTGNVFIDALPVHMIEKLLPDLREVDLAVGEQLYQQDVIPSAVYFPIDAVISKYQMLEDGRTIEVALAGREAGVAIAPAVSLKGSLNYCEVLIAGKALKSPAARVLEAVRRNPTMSGVFMRYMESQIRQISRRLLCNQYHTLEPRLATWLLMVSERRGSTTVKVTHDQIARALGYFRPTVSVALEELRNLGLVKQSRGRLTLTDPSGVEEAACACFAELSLQKHGMPVADPTSAV